MEPSIGTQGDIEEDRSDWEPDYDNEPDNQATVPNYGDDPEVRLQFYAMGIE
jgi:hypothetical protein